MQFQGSCNSMIFRDSAPFCGSGLSWDYVEKWQLSQEAGKFWVLCVLHPQKGTSRLTFWVIDQAFLLTWYGMQHWLLVTRWSDNYDDYEKKAQAACNFDLLHLLLSVWSALFYLTYSSKSSYWWCSCFCDMYRLESGGLNQNGDADILRSESDNFSKRVCSDHGCWPVFAMDGLSDHQMDSRTNGVYQRSHPPCWWAEAMVPWLAPMIHSYCIHLFICLLIGTVLDTHSMTRFFILGMAILRCLPLYRLVCTWISSLSCKVLGGFSSMILATQTSQTSTFRT